jgi:hypothetical protein
MKSNLVFGMMVLGLIVLLVGNFVHGNVIASQRVVIQVLEKESQLMLQELQALGPDGFFTQAEAEYFCDFVDTFRER